MGACPNPDKPIIYAYISMIPYVTPLIYLLISALTRKISHFKIFFMLASAYVIGDKLLKNIFKGKMTLIKTHALSFHAKVVLECQVLIWLLWLLMPFIK